MDILVDLWHQSEGCTAQYDVFWTKCTEYISEYSAVHERQHGDISYMATAISVCDMINQVKQRCPTNTPIPSEAWIRLNFSPKIHGQRFVYIIREQTCCTKEASLKIPP